MNHRSKVSSSMVPTRSQPLFGLRRPAALESPRGAMTVGASRRPQRAASAYPAGELRRTPPASLLCGRSATGFSSPGKSCARDESSKPIYRSLKHSSAWQRRPHAAETCCRLRKASRRSDTTRRRTMRAPRPRQAAAEIAAAPVAESQRTDMGQSPQQTRPARQRRAREAGRASVGVERDRLFWASNPRFESAILNGIRVSLGQRRSRPGSNHLVD